MYIHKIIQPSFVGISLCKWRLLLPYTSEFTADIVSSIEALHDAMPPEVEPMLGYFEVMFVEGLP